MMFVAVAVAGYTIMSGSKLFLNEINVPFIVINAINRLTDNVATITVSMAGNSVSVTPQKSVPKRIETRLIVTLVARVNTIVADINL